MRIHNNGFSAVVFTIALAVSMLTGVVGAELIVDDESGASVGDADVTSNQEFYSRGGGNAGRQKSRTESSNSSGKINNSAGSSTGSDEPTKKESQPDLENINDERQYVVIDGRINSQSRQTIFESFRKISTTSDLTEKTSPQASKYNIVANNKDEQKITESLVELNRRKLPSGEMADGGSFEVAIEHSPKIRDIVLKRNGRKIGSKSTDRIARQIIDEAALREDGSHCELIPFQQQTFQAPCQAIFDNEIAACKEGLPERRCKQNMILAKTLTPECDTADDENCGFHANKAIWARAIRDRDKDLCTEITDTEFQDRCKTTLEETRKLYSGSIKNCVQTAKNIDSDSGGYYECMVGTAMYQNDPSICSTATKEKIYPGLREDLKKLDYYKSERLYQKLRQTCRRQIDKEISIRFGQGKGTTDIAREFYSIPERANGIFTTVVFSR